MRSSNEFRDEIYLRAKKEKQRIKRRKRTLLTIIPCFAVIVTLSLYGVYLTSSDTKSSGLEETTTDKAQTHTEHCEDNLQQNVTQEAELATELQKTEQQMTQSAVQKPSSMKPPTDESFENLLITNKIFTLQPQNNITELAVCLNSKDELLSFINNNCDLGFSDQALSGLKYYDDKFFNQQSLIVIAASFDGSDVSSNKILIETNGDAVNINIKAERTDKKEDAKLVLIPLEKQMLNENAKINVSFS